VIVPHEEIRAQVMELWESGGLPRGHSTGWPSVDRLYTVGLGQWTLLTGHPGSGKSEWLDAMMVNLAKSDEWRFIIYSPENWPLALHHAKIIEKYIGKPFNPGPNERVSKDEVDEAEEWMKGKFVFARPSRPDIITILDESTEGMWVERKFGVVVDPWNQLEHHRTPGMTETEYISQTLTTVIDWVRKSNVHLWLVAHPAKMQKDKQSGKLPIPTPNDVSGSAHWWAKADNCITVWRDQVEGSQDVDIHVQKVRFKHIGRIGLATLKYDRVTGRYHEPLRVVSSYATRDE
jgi:twinkle protein